MAVVIPRIKPLSLQLANQIAAGEVVERPASVVKELLENAVDARSSRITIDIERGGSALIRVSDDGDGIDRDDLALAVTRHATSKLHTLTELERVNSLGFRGEALASISAVSKLSIQSKQAGQEQAWMINTGTDSDFANYSAAPQPVAHPQGSTITVRDLFYNTPARRKFMRTVKTEFKHIDNIVKRIALSQFNIAFKLTHNKKLLRNLPKAVTEKAIHQRISKLFSPEFLSHSKKVDFTASHFTDIGTLRLWGWVSAPQWHRNQPDWQFFYVNGRYIKDKLVNHALRQAYQELLPADAYSAYLLYLEIDPEHVDVNVHPTKHEVRFRQARLIHDFIYSALNQAIGEESTGLITEHSDRDGLPDNAAGSINTAVNAVQEGHSCKNQADKDNHYSNTDNQYQSRVQAHPYPYPNHPHPVTSQKQVADHLDSLSKLYQTESSGHAVAHQEKKSDLAGKTDNSQAFFGHSLGCQIPDYLLSQKQSTDGQAQLFVINILRAQQFLLTRLFHPGQQTLLLIPHSVSLTARDIESLLHYQSELCEWGMELSQLTADTMLVRSLPSLYAIPGCQIDTEGLIKQVLHSISLDVKELSSDEPSTLHSDLFAALLKSLTTRSLISSEQEQLLNLLSEQINQLDSKQANIDQQPVWVVLDTFDLDRLFK